MPFGGLRALDESQKSKINKNKENIFNSNATYLTQFSTYLHEILHEQALITVFSRPGLLWSLKVIKFLRKSQNEKIWCKIAIFPGFIPNADTWSGPDNFLFVIIAAKYNQKRYL